MLSRVVVAVVWSTLMANLTRAQDSPPNVILVITDDQGYGDVAAHGNNLISTPNLDRLHAESVRCTDYHVDPTCSPSRSALMTGRYSTRTGVWHTIMGRSLMAPGEVTLAEVFRDGGYRTGMFGKWHLGDNYPCRPQDQGFDYAVWHRGGGVGQGPDYWDNDYFDDTYQVNGTWQKFTGYCTDVWFREATRFIERNRDQPFFAYISTNAPHGPYLVDESYSTPYRESGAPPTMAKFYGMITNIDENVGRLRARLEELGLAENTLLVFTTDNGTAAGRAPRRNEASRWQGYNAGMRGQKGSEFDGGHRVPLFWHWPAGGLNDGRDVELLTAHIDVLPTLADLCGLTISGGLPRDGVPLTAALRGEAEGPRRRTLFVHSQRVEHPQKWRKCAVMTERWRLVNGEQLYDIGEDPAQSTDVSASHADVVTRLRAAYDTWWQSLVPVFDDHVRIGVGGPEDPVELMSHDWHTDDRGVPWHQNHVRNGYVGNGRWTLQVERAGDYEISLYRWPAHLQREMDCVGAAISVKGRDADCTLDRSATVATFRLHLDPGPVDLLTTLSRWDGTEHGAYFAAVKRSSDLQQAFEPHRRSGFDPVVEPGDSEEPVSKFGGLPWLPTGSKWPVCPGCDQPMRFFVQLDVASLPADVGATGTGLLQFFMCAAEKNADLCFETYDHYADAEVVRLIDSGAAGGNALVDVQTVVWPAQRIVKWKRLDDYPEYVDAGEAGVVFTPELEAAYEAAQDEDRAPAPATGDKLGGWPYWVQNPEWARCRQCQKLMRLVLQIDSQDNVPFMLGDAGIGHIWQCPNHPDVLAWGWACH